MSEATVITGLVGLGFYLAIGLVIGLVCVFGAIGRIDPAAKTMPYRARFLVLPGLAALWPLILVRVINGKGPPIQ